MNPLSMSMFASKGDYRDAIEKQEGYHPEDAYNQGEADRLNECIQNRYDSSAEPVCHAAYERGASGKPL